MENEVIISLLSLCGTLAGSFAGIITSGKLTNYRITELEKKVEKHNGVIERVYELEKHEAVTDETVEVINHRIKDLEGFHKENRKKD